MKNNKLLVNSIVIICLILTTSLAVRALEPIVVRSNVELAMKTISILLGLDYIIFLIGARKKEKAIIIKRLVVTVIVGLILWFGADIIHFLTAGDFVDFELFRYIDWTNSNNFRNVIWG